LAPANDRLAYRQLTALGTLELPTTESYWISRVGEILKVGFMSPRLLLAGSVIDPRLTVANITFFKDLQDIWRGRRSVAESLASSVWPILQL
jgi:hypothetical protein